MDKKVSIIIPVYNAEKTIKSCVDAILKQSYKNLEIILVNDGSKDDSLNICNNLKALDNRILVVNKENGGPSTARNEGLKYATGYYIQFVDSDDIIDSDYTEKLVSYIENYNDVDLVVSCMKIISGKTIRNVFFDKERIFNLQDPDFMNQQNYYGLMASPCNKIYIKHKITSEFPKDIKNGEDAIFNLEYLKNCKNIFLTNKEAYNYFYENPNSLTKKYSESRFLDNLVVRKKLKMYFKDIGLNGDGLVNRLLLREICSITKSLIKENFSKKQKLEKIKNIFEHEQVREACKNYLTYGISEKLAFYLIKKKKIKLFYLCCKLK